MNDETVRRLRRQTPGCAERIHLDNAGAALSPEPVVETILAHLRLEQRIGGYQAARQAADSIASSYRALAELLGCAPEQVAFTASATDSYARALSALTLAPGDEILTTTNDYVSNQIMFLSLAARTGASIDHAADSPSGEIDLDMLRRRVRERRPRLVAVTHVPTNSGLVQPIEEIGAVCRDHDTIYLVDACQSVGQLPLDVERIGCDFLTASSRKFLRGPRGSGFLYVGPRILRSGLSPLFPDMRGATWTARDRYELQATARRFEHWEQSFALMLGTAEAARYATAVGVEAIRERATRLAARLRDALRAAELEVLDRGTEQCAIVTVALRGCDPETVHDELERNGINCSISYRVFATIDFDRKRREWAVRLSPHYYNTESEIDEAAERVVGLARGARR